jgi:hypothetical protein
MFSASSRPNDDLTSGAVSSVIVYEYPFNERIRAYLRVEYLFDRFFSLLTRLMPSITKLLSPRYSTLSKSANVPIPEARCCKI